MIKRMFGNVLKKEKGPTRYWIISAGIIGFLIILYCAAMYIEPVRALVFPEKVSDQVIVKELEDPTIQSDNTPQSLPEKVVDSVKSLFSRPESAIYSEMHKMANSKILADEIWGEIKITKEKAASLIQEVTDSDFDDKEILLDMLSNWEKGDFSHAVEEHNYLWEQLNGTVGEAYGLRTGNE